jgi:hypothetical protein
MSVLYGSHHAFHCGHEWGLLLAHKRLGIRFLNAWLNINKFQKLFLHMLCTNEVLHLKIGQLDINKR